MYTRCPHCETWFRIGAKQLAQAHGQVRCGVCSQVFNALASLSERTEQRIRLETAAASGEAATPAPSTPHDTTAAPPHDEADLPPLPTAPPDGGLAAPWITADGGSAAATLRREPSLGPEGVDVGPISVEGRPAAAPPTTRARHTSGVSIALWSFANLLLIATLLGQYAYFHREELAQYSELRPWLGGLCLVLGCEVPLRKDPSRISLLNRVVQSHPHHDNALLIDATLVNDADFTQPYPIVELRFSDLNNHLVAGRRFRPYEYLPPGTDIKRGMPPHEPVHFSLEIADPGKEAVSFQFNLL